jgi:hypothetical protein
MIRGNDKQVYKSIGGGRGTAASKGNGMPCPTFVLGNGPLLSFALAGVESRAADRKEIPCGLLDVISHL